MDTHVANENKKDEDKKIISFFKISTHCFFIFVRDKKLFSYRLASISMKQIPRIPVHSAAYISDYVFKYNNPLSLSSILSVLM